MFRNSLRFLCAFSVFLSLFLFGGIILPQSKADAKVTSILPRGILSPEFSISIDTIPAGDSEHQQVAYNPKHNEYLVVYDVAQPGSHSVYARRISGNGQALNEFAIAADSADNFDPSVAYDPINDRYLVVWSANFNGDFPKYDIYGRLVSWNGSMFSTPNQIYTWPDRSFINSRVVWNSVDHEFLVAWTAIVFSTGHINDVAIVRVNADGTRVSGAALLATSGSPDEVDLAYQPANNLILAAWSEDYPRSPSGVGRRVSVVVLIPNLSVASPAHPLAYCMNSSNHDDPDIIPYSAGHYISACMQRGDRNQYNGTEMKELDAGGNELLYGGGGGGWSMDNFGTQDMAGIPGSLEWLQVYDVQDSASGTYEIEGRRNSNNEMGWTDLITGTNRDLCNPRLAPDNPGLIVYQGRQTGGSDLWRIYGRTWVPWPAYLPVILR